MKLTVVNTGSKGNCYILYNDREALMLEAGAPFMEVLRAVGPEVCGRIRACLVTHEHGDHAKYVKDVLDHAIPIYATSGTIGALKGKGSRICRPVNLRLKAEPQNDRTPWEQERIGGFDVLAFKTVHDAASPCGFFIRHADFGNLLFATDTYYVPAFFKDLTNILIECNYDTDMLRDRTDIPETLKKRIRTNHQSLDACVSSLLKNDLSRVNMILLIHMSEKDGNPQLFKETVRLAVGPGHSVEAAEKGAVYEISRTPF